MDDGNLARSTQDVGSLFIGVIGRHRLDRLVDKLKESNEQLFSLSAIDPLTDLLNRRAFTAESEKFFELHRRSGQAMAVLMMDLDHFKKFNDRFGHQEGDRAICLHADIMRRVFKRRTDILGRYGGEEFIAVTMAPAAAELSNQAADILAHWKNSAMAGEGKDGKRLLSCSIGICRGYAADFDALADMIELADRALYCAKNRGRARFVVAQAGVPERQWETGYVKLHEAELVYQDHRHE